MQCVIKLSWKRGQKKKNNLLAILWARSLGLDCISAIANVGATVCECVRVCVRVSAPLCVIARSARHAYAQPARPVRPPPLINCFHFRFLIKRVERSAIKWERERASKREAVRGSCRERESETGRGSLIRWGLRMAAVSFLFIYTLD